MSSDTCHHIIVAAFPRKNGPHFRTLAGAVVGCWVRADNENPLDLIRTQLEEDGWTVGAVLSRSNVDETTYESQEGGRAEFEEACSVGFSAHLHLRRRETIALNDWVNEEGLAASEYETMVRRYKEGIWSFLSEVDKQWANGVSPDGDDFLPLWASESDCRRWAEYWPDFEPTALTTDDLLGEDGILAGVAREEMWVGIGLKDTLITTDPQGLALELAACA